MKNAESETEVLLTCPRCFNNIRIKEKSHGKKVECPECGMQDKIWVPENER